MNGRKRLTLLAAIAGMTLAIQSAANAQTSAGPCDWARDIKLTNGKILTMDAKNSMVSEVTIQDGHFTNIGKTANEKLNPCTKIVNLHGRTVVPGLIDTHNHFISLGLRPGYDVRLETAFSIAEIQDLIKARIKAAPPGAFITATNGWSVQQLEEKRMPTMAELDAAAPDNPVFISPTGPGGGLTNTLGKKFFESKGLMVSRNGTLVSAGGPGGNSDTIAALRSIQTFEDEKRGVIDADNYSVSLGLTTNVDQGFNFLAGTPDLQDSQVGGPGIETFSPWTIYDAFLALDREGKLTARLRIFHYAVDKEMEVPIIKERLLNNFPFFGDDMLRASGVGERAVQWSFANGPAQNAGGGPAPAAGTSASPPPPRVLVEPANFVASLQIVAKEGWPFSQHSTSLNEDHIITGAFEKVNAVTPIANLRWSISHVPKIDEETLNRLKAIGAGVEPHSWSYMNGRKGAGPPFRMILDNGIHAGGGSDAVAVTALDPWLMIYYMVTGKNSGGELINDGQQITRIEALRLYTANNPWFFHEEDKLGSIEKGKLGDLAVLSADYTDPARVSDEDIRRIKSVLTVVGGKIVYDVMPR
jgi:predicted amidohydrolase YtcJ